MNGILKAAHVEKQAVNAAELALINKQALRELTAEEVFTFRMAACDNQEHRSTSCLISPRLTACFSTWGPGLRR